MAEKWFVRAIGTGLQGLVTLRLDGAPPADSVAMTLDIWLIALTKNRHWDEEQDAERIKATFESLFAGCETWPSPARFLRDLKPRKLPPLLPKPDRSTEQLKSGNAALDNIVATLKGRSGTQTALKTNKQFEYSRQRSQQATAAELSKRDSQFMEQQDNE